MPTRAKQLTGVSSQTEGPRRLVAVKKLNNTSGLQDFQNELKMLIKLTPLPTPHLAKLLATFEIQGKTATERDYCFMSETADRNLQEFWRQEDPHSLDSISPTELAKWVARQCHGLAEGMKSIHDYRYEHDPNPEGAPLPRHGFHGDVKPDNILVYTSWVGHEHPLGILQITDFGISSFHHTASLSGISRGRDSHPYRPPESHLPFMKTTQSHDIWTLGCLFLDFATWLVKGPLAINKFRENRRSYGFNDKDTITTFYQVDEKDGKTAISISEDVLEVSVATGFWCFRGKTPRMEANTFCAVGEGTLSGPPCVQVHLRLHRTYNERNARH